MNNSWWHFFLIKGIEWGWERFYFSCRTIDESGLVKSGTEHINVWAIPTTQRGGGSRQEGRAWLRPHSALPETPAGHPFHEPDSYMINWPAPQPKHFVLGIEFKITATWCCHEVFKVLWIKHQREQALRQIRFLDNVCFLPQNLIFLISIWGPERLEESCPHSRHRARALTKSAIPLAKVVLSGPQVTPVSMNLNTLSWDRRDKDSLFLQLEMNEKAGSARVTGHHLRNIWVSSLGMKSTWEKAEEKKRKK